MERFKKIALKLVLEILYIIFNIIYLIYLNKLNKELLESNKTGLELLGYENNKPIVYFVFAVTFVILGVFLIFYRIKYIKNGDLQLDILPYVIVSMITIVILIIKTIIKIYIPILRTIILIFIGIILAGKILGE